MKLLQSLVNLVNPHLVRVEKAESYSGAEMHWAEVTGVGMVNSFLAGNNLFRSLIKKKVEQNLRGTSLNIVMVKCLALNLCHECV